MNHAVVHLTRATPCALEWVDIPQVGRVPFIRHDGVMRAEALELIRARYAGSLDRNRAGGLWRTHRLTDVMVMRDMAQCHFPGISKGTSPGLTFKGIIHLLTALPKGTKAVRDAIVTSFERVFAGDPSLHAEIDANAALQTPLHRIAREDITRRGDAEDIDQINARYTEPSPTLVHDTRLDEPQRAEDPILSVVQFEQMLEANVGNRLDKLYAQWEDDEASLMRQAVERGMVFFGDCYAFWNPLFPDLVKIGWTGRSPLRRMRELSGTGVPEPFQLIASVPCFQPQAVEKRIHAHFSAARKYGKKKEFFLVRIAEVDDYFAALKREMAGVIPKAEAQPAKRKRDELLDRMDALERLVKTGFDALKAASSEGSSLRGSVPSTPLSAD